MVVVFALVTHGEDGDGGGIGDLEQGDVAGFTEGNDQFAQKGIGVVRLADSEVETVLSLIERC